MPIAAQATPVRTPIGPPGSPAAGTATPRHLSGPRNAAGLRHADYVPGQLLVTFKTRAPQSQRLSALRAGQATARGAAVASAVQLVTVPGDQASLAAARARLAASPGVASVSYNYIRHATAFPDDPIYADFQKPYLNTIGMPGAWAISTGTSKQVIAIVDTGLDETQADFAGRIVPGYDFVAGTTTMTDPEGHGTFVAGVAAAKGNNGIDVAGVDWGARIMPVRVLDATGSGTDSNIVAGIEWAANHGATVINLSLGGAEHDPAIDQAVAYANAKGVVVVAAAGNDGNVDVPSYPAASPGVVAVGATDPSGHHAFFSTSGDWVSLSAPGYDITSTYPASADFPDGLATGDGTSFSSPMVAGAAALIRDRFPLLTPAQIRARLMATATDTGPQGFDPFNGAGVLDVQAALGGPKLPSLANAGTSAGVLASSALSIAVPGQTSSNFAADGQNRWFTFTVPTAGPFTIRAQPSVAADCSLSRQSPAQPQDPELTLYDAAFARVGQTSQDPMACDNQSASVSLNLAAGQYYVLVDNAAHTGSGTNSFTTSVSAALSGGTPSAGAQPWVTDASPAPLATGVATGVAPTITLGRTMNASTISSATVTLLRGETGDPVPATVSFGSGVVTVTPTAALAPGTDYVVQAMGVKDLAGNAMPETRVSFTTQGSGTPAAVTGFTAAGGIGTAVLHWINPPESDLNRIVLKYANGTTPPLSADGSGTVLLNGYGTDITVPGLIPGQDYAFAIWTRDFSGNISTAQTAVLSGTTGSVRFSPATVAYGQTTTVTATFLDGSTHSPVVGATAQIYWRHHGTTSWSRIAVGPTNGSGQLSVLAKPPWPADFYAYSLGTSSRIGTLVTPTLSVAFSISYRLSATRAAPGVPVTVSGGVLPGSSGQLVYFENYYGSLWHLVATKPLTSSSSYAFSIKLSKQGAYSFRLVKLPASGYAAGTTPTFTITVV